MKSTYEFEKSYIEKQGKELPEIRSGDTVKIHTKIKEGEKERIQIFTGTVIRNRGSGLNKTLTVRKMSYGIGVERIFPLYSPSIEKIEIAKRGKVRRSRLYYLRERRGKAARIKEKR
ncbi:MAG: 50S ribosomal protein L19 [Deltaproteobacteria bacterium]|nr:50S ribosomal protein L19 [Deltaproteobacteria bacterium]